MRIAIASYQGYDGPGVVHAHYFANCLVDLGHEVFFLLNGSATTAARLAHPPAYRIRETAFSDGFLAEDICAEIEDFAPHVVHLWTPRHLPALAGIGAWMASDARLVIHYEDDEEFVLSKIASNSMFSDDDLGLYRFLSRSDCDPARLEHFSQTLNLGYLRHTMLEPRVWNWIHPVLTPVVEKLADGYTSISPPYGRYLTKRWGKPVRTLYPGVNFEHFAAMEKPRELVESLGLTGRTVLLYSGSIAGFHDFTSILRALPEVKSEHPDVALVQIGYNHIAGETGEIIRDLDIADNVLFLGPVPHHSMPRYLALADVFVGCVRIDEFNKHRLPSKLPEYMAMARPILIMDQGVGDELEEGLEVVKVQDESPGELGRGLKLLLEKRAEWPAMGQRLLEKAKVIFDWEGNARHLLAFYEELLEMPREDRPEGTSPVFSFAGVPEILAYSSKETDMSWRAGTAIEKRVLVLTEGRVARKMSGTGIRYLEIARALSRHFEVVLAQELASDLEVDGIELEHWNGRDPGAIVALARDAHAVIIHGYLLERFPELRDVPGRLIVDLYCPFIFENMFIHRDRGVSVPEQEQFHEIALRVLSDQLRAGDYFLCSSDRQRDWVLGMLTALGRLDPAEAKVGVSAEEFVGVVPFGLPEDPPETFEEPVMKGVWDGIDPDDLVLLWGGGLWSWLDPSTVIKAMEGVSKVRSDVKLVFLSTRTAEDVIEMPVLEDARKLADRLGLSGRSVIFNESGYIDYDRRSAYFLEADIGVCSHRRGFETHFSFRTRVLDYIHAGLPILTSEGDSLGELVESEGLGHSLPIGDSDSWTATILKLAESPEKRRRFRQRILSVRDSFSWPRTTKPLLEYCLKPADSHATPRLERRSRKPPSPAAGAVPVAELLAETVDTVGRLKSDLGAALRKSGRLEKELGNSRSKFAASEGERAALELRLFATQNSLSTLENDHGKLEGAFAKLRSEIDELRRLKKEHVWLKGHAARLEKKVALIKKIPLANSLWRIVQRFAIRG